MCAKHLHVLKVVLATSILNKAKPHHDSLLSCFALVGNDFFLHILKKKVPLSLICSPSLLLLLLLLLLILNVVNFLKNGGGGSDGGGDKK